MSSLFFYDITQVKKELELITNEKLELDLDLILEKNENDFKIKLEKYLVGLNNLNLSSKMLHELFVNMLEFCYLNKDYFKDIQIVLDTINKNKKFLDIGIYSYYIEKFEGIKQEIFLKNKIIELENKNKSLEKDIIERNKIIRDLRVGNEFLMKELSNANNKPAPISPSNMVGFPNYGYSNYNFQTGPNFY